MGYIVLTHRNKLLGLAIFICIVVPLCTCSYFHIPRYSGTAQRNLTVLMNRFEQPPFPAAPPNPKPTMSRPKKIRKLFSAEEDALLSRIMFEQPFTTWIAVAAQIPGRSARQCRDRWANYLSPENKNGPWTQEEDRLLTDKFREFGPQWTTIAKFFDGRSENNVKNRWYTHLRNKYNSPVKTPDQPIKPVATVVDMGRVPVASVKPHTLLPPISTLEANAPLRMQAAVPQLIQSLRLRSSSAQPFVTYQGFRV